MPGLLPRPPSITWRRNIRLAPCATRPFMGPTPINSSSSLKEGAMRDTDGTRTLAAFAWKTSATLCFVACLLSASAVHAQQGDEEPQKGIEQGNYNIKQSIEFGGRVTNISGDPQAYNTFVNLQQGPRLLGFTSEMQSLDHRGAFFDRLYFNNFGYGGDPNDVSRLRISKMEWYSFDALFRRDENFWDYSLQANPINPSAVPANAPAGF